MPEEKPKLVITTVGTSLIEKLGRKNIKTRNGWVDNKLFNQDLHNNITSYCGKNFTADAEKFYVDSQSDVKKTVELLTKELTDSAKDSSFAPAEVASLWKIGLNKKKDKVVLLYSDTPEGVFCYQVLSQFIKEKIAGCLTVSEVLNSNNESDKIGGLQPDDATKFVKEGLNNLFKKTASLLEKYEPNSWERFINITAGFKGVIPIQTLQSDLKHVPIIYLFEESDTIVKMISTNNGVDFWVGDNKVFPATINNYRRSAEN
jgi:CRISPR/Cas system-associated protein Csm6